MLFNSLTFAIFFPIVFFIYWFVLKNSQKKQNIFLLIASYFFYGYWDWRFLFLLAISTLLCYYGGFRINNASSKTSRKTWMIVFVIVNLSFLGFFKYFNFFIDSFQELLQMSGFTPHIHTLKIILPVGISFYSFHGLSYVLDYSNDSICYPKKYFYNRLHMNKEGRKVFTKKLANNLMEMQLLPK